MIDDKGLMISGTVLDWWRKLEYLEETHEAWREHASTQGRSRDQTFNAGGHFTPVRVDIIAAVVHVACFSFYKFLFTFTHYTMSLNLNFPYAQM